MNNPEKENVQQMEEDIIIENLVPPESDFEFLYGGNDKGSFDPISPEETNFLRFYLLCQNLATDSVRSFFDRKVTPVDLHHHLRTHESNLRGKWRCYQQQLNVLFPAVPLLPQSTNFDFFLLYKLIRNTLSVPAPAQGWGKEPLTSDVSETDDVERVRKFRYFLAHSEQCLLTDSDYRMKWTELSQAIQRLSRGSLTAEANDLEYKRLDQDIRILMVEDTLQFMKEVIDLQQEAEDQKARIESFEAQHILKHIREMNEQKDLGTLTSSDLEEIFKFGTYQCFWNRIFLVGQFAVGKSTLAKVLVGEEIPKIQESTDGIWIYRGRAGMKIDNKEWIQLPKGKASIDIIAGMLLSLQNTPEKDSQPKFSDTGDEIVTISKESNADTKNLIPGEALSKTSLDTSLEELKADTNDLEETLIENPRENLEENMAKQINIEKVNKLTMDAIREGKYRQRIVPFDIWDFGGQKEFYMTHQLFITSRGVFVLMFNGSKDLMEDEEVYLLRWVNCILTFCPKMINGFPRIIVVATHKDKVAPKERHLQRQKLENALEKLFKSHSGFNHLEIKPLIFINANDPRDPEIEELRRRLINRAFEHPRWGEKMPTAWVPLELMLLEKVEEGTNIIARKEMKALNEKNEDLVLSDPQLEDFLRVQHSLGKILYFDDSNLRDHFIINPVFLVDVLRSLVTDQLFWPKDEQLRNILERLSTKGTIFRKDIIMLWQQEHFRSFMEYADYLLNILVHLDVLVLPVFRHSGPFLRFKREPEREEFFIVPCMIKNQDDTSYLKDKFTNGTSIIMSYMFKGEIIPPALGFRLLASFISMYEIKTFKDQYMLFNDLVVVEIDENHDVVVQIRTKQVVIYLVHLSDVKKIEPTLASSIQECLTASITHISEFYAGLSESKTPETIFPFEIHFGVVCGETICFFPHSELPDDKSWRCDHGNVHSVRELALWFAEKVAAEHCPDDCKGLGRLELEQYPMDVHLRRLAAHFSPLDCRNIALCLKVPERKWTNLEFQFQFQPQNDPDDIKFKLLHCWKDQNPKGSFLTLANALSDCNISDHYLCHVLRDIELPEEYNKDKLNMPPDSFLLQKVRNHIGNSSMQLGIELGLTTSEIEAIRYQFIGKLPNQTEEILHRWKSEPSRATNKNLLKALNRIGKDGCLRGIKI